MGSGDFLRLDAQTPLTEHFIMAGAHGSISTNSAPVLAAARDTFCLLEAAFDAPRLHLRFWIDPKGTTRNPWPKPYFRGLDHLIFVGFDSQNSILVDLGSRRAIGRFSPAMGADYGYWRSVIFPVLITIMGATVGITELHCGCVARKGRGLLLLGPSGAGKSTLAITLAQSGFAYLSDDRTYISTGRGGLAAWGQPSRLKLRRDALEWFPQLGNLKGEPENNGEQAIRIDPTQTLGVQRLRRCEPHMLVFLKRQERPAFELSDISRHEAARELEEDLIAEAPGVVESQRAIIGSLAQLSCRRLVYGGSPWAVVHELSRHCC